MAAFHSCLGIGFLLAIYIFLNSESASARGFELEASGAVVSQAPGTVPAWKS
jgi:hypothetical protein